MKMILYMGISVNGYIAKSDGNSEFTSEEDLRGFFENSKKAGNIIMGANTYHEALRQGYFPFPGALNIVMTKRRENSSFGEKVIFTDKTPEEVIAVLSEKGFTNAFLAGGGLINSAFMKQGLIDEIYLDVEPLIFSKGIPIFAPSDFEYALELLEINKLNKDTVQLHYRVKK